MLKRFIILGLCLGLIASPIVGCDDDDDNSGKEQGGQEQGDKDLKINLVKSAKKFVESDINESSLNAFVKGQYDLNFELLSKSEDQIKNKNAMVSTFSIQSALGMTWAGAAGTTADEMKKALHFDDNAHKGLNKIRSAILDGQMEAVQSEFESADSVEVGINNDIYVSPKYTWAADWLDVLSVNYDAGVTEMNFAADPAGAAKYINDVVSRDTHERIKNLIPENMITPQTQLVLTNAIYFKAPWNHIEFTDSEETRFHLQGGTDVDASFINTVEYYPYAETADYQAVSLPLRGGHFAMLFVLPSSDGYDKLASSLNGDLMDGLFKNLDRKKVDVTLPTFTFETGLDLVEPFRALGMKQAFTDAADFSAMTQEPNMLLITAILHKSFIAVDKKGLEAAAATAVIMAENAIPASDDPVVVDINRPFFFMVYETRTQSPLFVGRVLNPAEK